MHERAIVEVARERSQPLTGAKQDYTPLLERIGEARFVLLGEASHGTHEFYEERARITSRLIDELGFDAVAVEADWPDAYRVHRYVRAMSDDRFATEALDDFKRFPTWMWRNAVVLEFVDWLRERNDALPDETAMAGFYGLDLYSLRSSLDAVLRYLEATDPEAARKARRRYACFDQFRSDQIYGLATTLGLSKSCQEEVTAQLVEMQQRAMSRAHGNRSLGDDEEFFAEQNARVVKNAEAYYRAMFLEEVSSWNLRDEHMFETLEAVAGHIERQKGRPAKIAVWAHNSHLGDARATEMGLRRGELNLGQLVREKYGREVVSIGFTTHHGTVTAASAWDGIAERKHVRPALPGSWEAAFHETGVRRFLLDLGEDETVREVMRGPALERAIGVIYRPETERISHYFHALLSEQFDVVIHFDETRAVEPLERTAEWIAGEVPETFPFAL